MTYHTIAYIAGRDQCSYDALLHFGATIVAKTLADQDYVPLRELAALGDEASLLEFVEHHLAGMLCEETRQLDLFPMPVLLLLIGG